MMSEKRQTQVRRPGVGRSNNLMSEESNRLKKIFDRYDLDKTGVINAKEMKAIVSLLNLTQLADQIGDTNNGKMGFSEFFYKFKTSNLTDQQLDSLKKAPEEAAKRVAAELREDQSSLQIADDEKSNITTQRVLKSKQAFDMLDLTGLGRVAYEGFIEHLQKTGVKFDAERLRKNFKQIDKDDAKELTLVDFVLASCSKSRCTSVRNLRLVAKEFAKTLLPSQDGRPRENSLEQAQQLFIDDEHYKKEAGFKLDRFYHIVSAFDDLDYNLDGLLSKQNLASITSDKLNPDEKQIYEMLSMAWEDHNLYFDEFYKYMTLMPLDYRMLAATARKIGNFLNDMPLDEPDPIQKAVLPKPNLEVVVSKPIDSLTHLPEVESPKPQVQSTKTVPEAHTDSAVKEKDSANPKPDEGETKSEEPIREPRRTLKGGLKSEKRTSSERKSVSFPASETKQGPSNEDELEEFQKLFEEKIKILRQKKEAMQAKYLEMNEKYVISLKQVAEKDRNLAELQKELEIKDSESFTTQKQMDLDRVRHEKELNNLKEQLTDGSKRLLYLNNEKNVLWSHFDDQNNKYIETLKNFQLEVAKLKQVSEFGECDGLISKITELSEGIQKTLKDKLEMLKTVDENLENQKTVFEKEKMKLMNENKELNKKIQEVRDEITGIANEKKALEASFESIQLQLTHKRKECDTLQKELSQQSKNSSSTTIRLAELEKDLTAAKQNADSFQMQLVDAQAMVKKLQNQLEEKDREIQRLQQLPNPNDPANYYPNGFHSSPYSPELNRFQNTSLADEINRQLDAKNAAHSHENHHLKEQMQLNEKEKAQLKAKIEELTVQVKNAEKKNESLTEEVNARIKAIEKLKNELHEKEIMITEFSNRAKINTNLSEKVENLNLQIIEKTASQAKTAESINNAKKKIKEHEATIKTLSARVRELESANAELRQAKELKNAEVIDLNEKLTKMTGEYTMLEEMLRGRDDMVARLTKRVERNKQLLEGLSKTSDGVKVDSNLAQVSMLQAKLDELTFELKSVEEKLAQANEELVNKDGIIEQQSKLIKEKEALKVQLEKQMATAATEFDEKLKELKKASAELMFRLNEENNASNLLKQQLKEKETALNNFRQAALRKEQTEEDLKAKFSARLQQLVKQCEKLTNRTDELLSEKKDLKTQLEVKKFEYDVIYDKLGKAKAEIEKLKKKQAEDSSKFSREAFESKVEQINTSVVGFCKKVTEETKQKIFQLEARLTKALTMSRGLKDELDKRVDAHIKETEQMQEKIQSLTALYENQKNIAEREMERSQALDQAFLQNVAAIEESYQKQINDLYSQLAKPRSRKA